MRDTNKVSPRSDVFPHCRIPHYLYIRLHSCKHLYVYATCRPTGFAKARWKQQRLNCVPPSNAWFVGPTLVCPRKRLSRFCRACLWAKHTGKQTHTPHSTPSVVIGHIYSTVYACYMAIIAPSTYISPTSTLRSQQSTAAWYIDWLLRPAPQQQRRTSTQQQRRAVSRFQPP